LRKIFEPISPYGPKFDVAKDRVRQLKAMMGRHTSLDKFEAVISLNPTIAQLKLQIKELYGIEVEFSMNDSEYDSVSSAAAERLELALKITADILKRGYPGVNFRSVGLKKIIFVNTLVNKTTKKEAGGLAYARSGNGTMVITVEGDSSIRGTIDHEFGHIEHWASDQYLEDPAWIALNPNGTKDYVHQRGTEVDDKDFASGGACAEEKPGFFGVYAYCGGPLEDRACAVEKLRKGGLSLRQQLIKDPAKRGKAEKLTGCRFNLESGDEYGMFTRFLAPEEYKQLYGGKAGKFRDFSTLSNREMGPAYWNRRLFQEGI